MPKKISTQAKYRNKKFTYDQYWAIHYTEVCKDKSEIDYQSVIKARCADSAVNILTKKITEDNIGQKLSQFRCSCLVMNLNYIILD